MEVSDVATSGSVITDPGMHKYLQEGAYDVGESQSAMEVSSKVDMALAYTSEKLTNIENLLMQISAGENNFGVFDVENDDIAVELIEKVFTFDLLYTILTFELRELDNLLSNLQDRHIDALYKLSTHEHSTEVLAGLVSKFHSSEELLKQSQERVLDMKLYLAKLKMTSFSTKQHEWKSSLVMALNEELDLSGMKWKPEMHTVEQMRALRMLEKSLAREVELEKKLTGLKQNEEDLKSKIRLMEQVAVCMEEAAGVAWGRFLEADNTAEVLMGISKELLGRLHIIQLHPTQREEEMKTKLQDCENQLRLKEASNCSLSNHVAELTAERAVVNGLREKVQLLEEKLKILVSQLEEANASGKTSHQRLTVMEGEIESLRENLYAMESRAENAEEKAAHLTDSNVELTEELDFLRSSNHNNVRKASELEKQLRELDILLHQSRASSESSQEQQSMLYIAIWDMETLIDELKQKVMQSESKAEIAEEQCLALTKTNSEANKELRFLRSKIDIMEKSLNQAALEKNLCAEDISIKASLMMDTVMQLALQRERLHNQLISISEENKLLREKLEKEQNRVSMMLQDNGSGIDKEFLPSRLDPLQPFSAKFTEISLENFQVERSPDDASPGKNNRETTIFADRNMNSVQRVEAKERSNNNGNQRQRTMFLGVLGVLLSILAAHLFHNKTMVNG